MCVCVCVCVCVRTTEIYYLTVLKNRSSKSRCWQVYSLFAGSRGQICSRSFLQLLMLPVILCVSSYYRYILNDCTYLDNEFRYLHVSECLCPLKKSYVETLMPHVMVLRGGSLGGKVMRREPSGLGLVHFLRKG